LRRRDAPFLFGGRLSIGRAKTHFITNPPKTQTLSNKNKNKNITNPRAGFVLVISIRVSGLVLNIF